MRGNLITVTDGRLTLREDGMPTNWGGGALSAWSYALLFYRHSRREFPVLAWLRDLLVILEQCPMQKFFLNMTQRPNPCLDLAVPPPNVSKKQHHETHLPGERRLWDVEIQTCRTHTLVLSYNSISTVYDFPSYHRHHDRFNASVYACYYLHTPLTHFTRQADGEPLNTSWPVGVLWHKSRQTENTDAMAESHSWRPESWLDWGGSCDWFHSHVSSGHAE